MIPGFTNIKENSGVHKDGLVISSRLKGIRSTLSLKTRRNVFSRPEVAVKANGSRKYVIAGKIIPL